MRGKRYGSNPGIPTQTRDKLESSNVLKRLTSIFAEGICLDFGCGDGRNLKLMNQGIGIDLRINKDLPGNSVFVRADLNFPLPFKSNAFDVVVCSHVLEHLDSPIKALWEIRRVLKEKGLLLWGFPNPGYLFFNFYKKTWADHLYAWNVSTARIQVEKAGFEVISVFRGFPKFWSPALSQILSIIPFSTYFSGEFWILVRKKVVIREPDYKERVSIEL